MKALLYAMLVALAGTVFAADLTVAVQQQRDGYERAGSTGTTAFVIPPSDSLADPEVVARAIAATADRDHVDVYRTEINTIAGGSTRVVQYAYLTDTAPQFFDRFQLDSGRRLTPAETRGSSAWMSSVATASRDQVGTIRTLPGVGQVEIRPMATAFEELPAAGTYYVGDARGSSGFVADLAGALTSAGAPTQPGSLAPKTNVGVSASANLQILLQGLVALVLIVVVVFVAYVQLTESKRIAVLRMHGFGGGAIWWRTSARRILVAYGAAAVVALVTAGVLPGAGVAFTVGLAVNLVAFLAVLLVASGFVSLYVLSSQLGPALKNRTDTKTLFAFNLILHAVAAVAIIVTASSIVVELGQASASAARLGNWNRTSGYGIFYPTDTGRDLTEFQSGQPGPLTAEVYGLYPRLDRAGGLYVDASQYEPEALAQTTPAGQYRSLVVNPNYLDAFPIDDESGRPVRVSDSETDWVVLAPATLKPEKAKLLAYFEATRHGTPAVQGIGDAERSTFGRALPPAVADQQVDIIWTKPQQGVFAFSPLVGPSTGNSISDPIVQVMTLGNSAGVDRENAITGSAGTALKVKLGGASTTEVLRDLQPLLRSEHLDDNLVHLVTLNGYVTEQATYYAEGAASAGALLSIMLLVLVLVTAQGLSVVFERFSRRVVVRKLLGRSFFARYREFVLILAITSVAQLLVALAANAAGASPLQAGDGSASAPAWVVLAVSASVFALDLLCSAIALTRIERRRTVDVIKGGF